MKSYLAPILLLVTFLSLACGSASNRQLQSISISATATDIGGQAQLVATGHFSAPPTTVTPLPVFWTIDLPPAQYVLTTQPFMIACTPPGGFVGPFVAMAPINPNAPSAGPVAATKMVSASTSCTQVQQ